VCVDCGVASSIYGIALVFGNYDSPHCANTSLMCITYYYYYTSPTISFDLSLSFGAKLLIQLQKHYDTYVEWNNYTRGLFLYAAVHIALPKENPKQKKLLVVKLFRLWLPKNLFLVLRPSMIINELVILLLLLHK